MRRNPRGPKANDYEGKSNFLFLHIKFEYVPYFANKSNLLRCLFVYVSYGLFGTFEHSISPDNFLFESVKITKREISFWYVHRHIHDALVR